MERFCVNRIAQTDSGDHEVHDVSTDPDRWCLPDPANRLDLGNHSSCREAVAAAKNHYSDVNGCRWCASDCHTT